jgi:hypothetical protein
MSIYTNRVQAPVKSVEFTGLEKPLQSFKELSAIEIAKKEKERTDQLASQQEKETQERAAQQERVRKQAEAARKEQEESAKEQRKQYMEMSEKVKAPSTLKMYDGHYAMLEEFAQFLADPETIKGYASSVEGEMEFNALVDQLLTLTSTFEGYYNQTYGEFGDPIDAPTWEAAVRRNQEGVKGGDINYDTSYEEMLSRMNRLDSKMHQKMEVRGGRVVFVDNDGNELVPGEDMLDLNVFRSEVSERPPRTGDQYIGSVFDPEAMNSPAAVEEQVIAALEDPDIMRDASRTYVEEMMIQNPDFSMTPEEVEANTKHREAAEKLYIKQAQEEAAKRQRDRADIPTGKTVKEDSVEAQEEEPPQVSEQAETTQVAVQEDSSALEEEVRNVEQQIGRPLTEEEKRSFADPEFQAMLRAAGLSYMDMSRFTPEDPRSRGNQPTSGLESIDIGGGTEVTPREKAPAAQVQSAESEPTPEELQAFAQDIGLDPRELSMDMFEPDTPLADAFRQYNIERSRIRSIVDQQRALNAERNQTMVDDFGDKFSGDLQEALANYGKTPEVQTQQQGDPYYDYGDEKINKMINVPAAYTTEGSTSTRGFEGDNIKLKTSPDPNKPPSELIGMSFNADAGEFVVNLSGDRQVKLSIDREGNMQLDPTDLSGFLDDVGNRIPMGLIVIQEFNKVYGDGAFGAIAGRLQNEALRSAGLLVE